MPVQLVGRIAWVQKDERAEPVEARRDCVGLEGRIVHAQTAETAQAVLATAAAVRAAEASVASPRRERGESAAGAQEAVETLHDLEPHFTLGPGRRLGL